MSLLLKNGRKLNHHQMEPIEILIDGGKIIEMATSITQSASEQIDLHGAFVSPGLIDMHVHLREPGYTNKETIITGSQAAAHGGYTTIAAMANLNPTCDTAEKFHQQVARNQQGAIKIEQYAPVTQGRAGQAVVDFDELNAAGARFFSDDGSGIQDAAVVYEGMQQMAKLGVPMCDHAQDMQLSFEGVINDGDAAKRLGLPGLPDVSETAQIARNLALAQVTGVHYHVCHVSTKESVDLVRHAKQQGVNVTCEVTPHHILLDESDITFDNSQMKMNPPLRDFDDRQACINGLMDGTIDIIATDHAPHTDEEKQHGFLNSPNGIVGSETAFALLYTQFVKSKLWTLPQLIDWMSTKNKEIFDLPNAGELKIGAPADIAVFDLEHEFTIDDQEFLSKGHNSPFIGKQAYGETVLTVVDGEVAYRRM
ncbi:dihydroorotase [Paucilactobacillus oligofermentans DSM 15707 = LMG 22743]|uniref:Dihydroorotase n=1 Tax=Paucilactobacillus oligofermentans DSM 15707 = LMG 22743 TaxID=1423778 RepID=A0A0R1RM00_9LACO|nr:dihydroorotase [Paucilactobacillus oligofermentans]KRL58111.1 dihydroorotase [Paucilactobacillus oligofermentans DSM 15707 = LMG 22743]CUS27020.1 Dihydroorotase PyrC [Paucilactobacillus oligofermentans DSM 15707 = LMG 22743]